MSKRKSSLEKRRSRSGYLFILPWVIGFALFLLWPMYKSFMMSFGDIVSTSGLQTKWIGWENYRNVFADVDFLPAFWNTLWTTLLYTPFIIVIALVIAILLNQKIKGRGVFRVIFFLPVLLGSGIVMAQLGNAANIMQLPPSIEQYVNYYFSSDIANFINQILEQIIRVFWKTGVQIIIFLGGLQSIGDSYYEAAKVDNANAWDMLWKITLPMLSPLMYLNVIYTIIDSFRSESNEISGLIISQVYQYANYSYGSAMGWIYFLISFSVVLLATLIFRRYVYYEK